MILEEEYESWDNIPLNEEQLIIVEKIISDDKYKVKTS